MISRISDKIWKISLSSNLYFLDFDDNLIIDTGDRKDRQDIKLFLPKVVDPKSIKKVIFTHLHYDHIGNFDLFQNARFYAGKQAINDWKKDQVSSILNEEIAEKFKVDLHEVHDMHGLEVIETPGHTRGSICLWYKKEKILFSGDTMFDRGLGRTDLPTSSADEMHGTVLRLLELKHKILCPGHDY